MYDGTARMKHFSLEPVVADERFDDSDE